MDPQAPFSPAERAGVAGAASGRPVAHGCLPTGIASALQAPQHLPPVSSVLTTSAGASSEALSPLSSGVNSTSSQSSQATPQATPSSYYHQTGSWTAPGSSSGYTLSSISSQNQSHSQSPNQTQHNSLMQAPYHGGAPRTQNYSPGVQYSNFRTSQSSTGSDSVTLTSYSDQLPPFAPSLGSGGGGSLASTTPTLPSQQPHSILGSHPSVSQAPPPVSSPSEAYRQGSYSYPPASGPPPPSYPAFNSHASSSHPSPSTSAGMSRGIPSMVPAGPMMHPNLAYSNASRPPAPHHQHYSSYAPHMGSVMSNIGNPNQPMSMIGPSGVYPMAQHQHMYHGHADPTANRLQDRPFRCDQCNQSFNRNHDLKRHKRIHLAVKPFPCTYCEKSFSRKDALKRHRLVKGCGKAAEDGSNTQADSDGVDVKSETPASGL